LITLTGCGALRSFARLAKVRGRLPCRVVCGDVASFRLTF
jgi:hypothetical protein